MKEDRAAAAVSCGKQPCFFSFSKKFKKIKKSTCIFENTGIY
jgi:hypothetical protein